MTTSILRTSVRDKDAEIGVLRKQLEEAKERENQNLTEILTMTSKLSWTRAEEEKREKELRDLMKHNESLEKELEVTHRL